MAVLLYLVVLICAAPGYSKRFADGSTTTNGTPSPAEQNRETKIAPGAPIDFRQASRLDAIFVSPFGSDANTGSESAPLHTLRRAQQVARTARQRFGWSPEVVLEEGTYRVHAQPTLILTAEDGGVAQAEALWRSARPNATHGRAARVSGGVRHSKWEQAPGKDAVWRTNASGLMSSSSWPFRTLRIGDSLWPSARWPLANASHSWLFLGNWSCDPKFHSCTSVQGTEGSHLHAGRLESTIPATLGINPRELLAERDYASADLNLFGGFERDVFSQVLPLHKSPSPWNFSNPLRPTLAIECYGYQPNERFFFSNAKAGLVPGSWWLDREEGWLYLHPDQPHTSTTAEWFQSTDISAPSSSTLVTIHGAQWLQLSRLAFIDTVTQWQGYMGSAPRRVNATSRTERSYEGATAGWPDCAVHVNDGSAHITISNSSFEQLGGCGIAIKGDVENVNVIGCLFTSIAAHGILINGFEEPAPGHSPHELRFQGNVFFRVGVLFAGASALHVDGGAFITITRNRFEEMPRNAIGLSSTFRAPMVMTTNVVIKENVIRDTCMQTDDTGAVVVYAQQADDAHSNLSFVDQSILIERNNISQTVDQNSKDGQSVCTHGIPDIPGHAVTCRNHSWAVYCDGVSSGVNVTSNILGGAMQGGIYFHQGGNNLAQNNIILDGSQYQLCVGTADQISNVLRRNIFVWRDPSAKVLWDFNVLPGSSSRDDILQALAGSDYNLFWCTDPSVDVLRNSSLFPLGGNGGVNGWQQASKFDAHSIVADPLFTAPYRGDYSLRNNSPALSKLYFQPIGAIDPMVPHLEDVGADQRW